MVRKTHAQKPEAKKKSAANRTGMKVSAALAGAAALAAAGYYFFYGSQDGAKRRKKVTAWSKRLKQEVVIKSRELEALNRRSIAALVKKVSKAYEDISSIDRADLTAAVKELEHNWEAIKQEAGRTVRAKAASAERTAKKTLKKMAK